MKDYIIPLVVAIIGSSAFTTIINYILDRVKSKNKKETASELGLKVLLEDRIAYVGEVYIRNGFIYAEDRDRINRMWQVYHFSLGGNGHLDAIMSLVNGLPIHIKNE